MPIDYECNMKQLLEGVNAEIKSMRNRPYSTEVSDVNVFQVGILPVMIAYPAVAVLPNREVYMNFKTGGKYDVARTIRIEGFVKEGTDVKRAQERATKIGEKIREGLLRNLDIKTNDSVNRTITFNHEIGQVNLAEPQPGTDYVIGKFVLESVFYSKGTYPSNRNGSLNIQESDQDTVFDKLVSTIKNNQGRYYDKVKQISSTSLPVFKNMSFPAIFIEEEVSDFEEYEVGRDLIVRRYRISVFTKALPKRQLLWDNIEVIEGLKDVLHINYNLGGNIKNSSIAEIVYQISVPTNTNLPLYNTSLLFEAECRRSVTFDN